MSGQTMRVRVAVTVTIDRDAWADEFGMPGREPAADTRAAIEGEAVAAIVSTFAHHPSVTVGMVTP